MKTKVVFHKNSDSVKKNEFFDENRRRHRIDGPAKIYYDKEGNVRYREYWVEGVRLKPWVFGGLQYKRSVAHFPFESIEELGEL